MSWPVVAGPLPLLRLLLDLGTAFGLGVLIGLERQWRQRTAGLRTHTLVAVGAAIFVALGCRLYELDGGHQTPITVVAYVVSGIGFLGAGAIMKEGGSISGLNTAATLWGSGAVGACAGADLPAEALVSALFVLASNTLLRPVASRINRRPFADDAGEAVFTVYLICAREHHAALRQALLDKLEQASYPVRQVLAHPFGSDEMELELSLYATAVQAQALDAVMTEARGMAGVRQAFWHAGEAG